MSILDRYDIAFRLAYDKDHFDTQMNFFIKDFLKEELPNVKKNEITKILRKTDMPGNHILRTKILTAGQNYDDGIPWAFRDNKKYIVDNYKAVEGYVNEHASMLDNFPAKKIEGQSQTDLELYKMTQDDFDKPNAALNRFDKKRFKELHLIYEKQEDSDWRNEDFFSFAKYYLDNNQPKKWHPKDEFNKSKSKEWEKYSVSLKPPPPPVEKRIFDFFGKTTDPEVEEAVAVAIADAKREQGIQVKVEDRGNRGMLGNLFGRKVIKSPAQMKQSFAATATKQTSISQKTSPASQQAASKSQDNSKSNSAVAPQASQQAASSSKNNAPDKPGFFSRMGSAIKATGSKVADATGNLVLRESDFRQRVSGKDRSLVERNQGIFDKLFSGKLGERDTFTHAGFLCTVIQNISKANDEQMQKWDKALQEIVAAPNKPLPEITVDCASHVKPELVNYKFLSKKYAEVIDVIREIQKARKDANGDNIKDAPVYRKRLHDLEYEICTLKDKNAAEKRSLEYLKRSDRNFLERLLGIKDDGKLDPKIKQERMTAAFVDATKAYDTYFDGIIAKMRADNNNKDYTAMYKDLENIKGMMKTLSGNTPDDRAKSIDAIINVINNTKTKILKNMTTKNSENNKDLENLGKALDELTDTLRKATSTEGIAVTGGKVLPRIKGHRPAKKSTAAKPKPRTHAARARK